MKIIADTNIPYVKQVFSPLGDVFLQEGRAISAKLVSDADVLLVRSVTHVDEPLLNRSQVRFVGTATIGTDHVDIKYLQQQGIGFASAPGSNAISAAEYVVSALTGPAMRGCVSLPGSHIALVGCGNVGSRVLSRLEALGAICVVNDPPRQARYKDRNYVDFDEILDADIVTVHTPLNHAGQYPTYHLCDERFFARLKPNAIFINTARGAVVDERGLKGVLEKRKDLQLILDVWDGEPEIDVDLLRQVSIGTPHIAGYSLDGKVRGTEMIYRAACEYFGCPVDWRLDPLPVPTADKFVQVLDCWSDEEAITRLIQNSYDCANDDKNLRKIIRLEGQDRGKYFDELRRDYPVRREFSYYQVGVPASRQILATCLSKLGFKPIIE